MGSSLSWGGGCLFPGAQDSTAPYKEDRKKGPSFRTLPTCVQELQAARGLGLGRARVQGAWVLEAFVCFFKRSFFLVPRSVPRRGLGV